ncbi:MAG: hypothetical protein WCT16_03415 [Candidatus Buchananbacteria bacterium]
MPEKNDLEREIIERGKSAANEVEETNSQETSPEDSSEASQTLREDIAKLKQEMGGGDLSEIIKVAILRAEMTLKKNELPVNIVWNSLLSGLALACGGQAELIRRLLTLKNQQEDVSAGKFVYGQETIMSWYLSAKFPIQEIFVWFEEAGSKDDETVAALVLSLPWNGDDYDGLDDLDIIEYILASGWDQPRQMAAMINNNMITPGTIVFLINSFGGDSNVVELIGRCGRFNENTFRAVQSIYGPSKKEPPKRVIQWSKRRIWYVWDKLGIANEQKVSLFYQALGRTLGAEKLVEFLHTLPLEDEEIITHLLSIGLSLGKIADIYAPKVVQESNAGMEFQDIPMDNKQLSPEFVTILQKWGKTDQEIVRLLVDYEFTLYMITTSLTCANWEPTRIFTALLAAGCGIVLISRMVEAAAQGFKEGNNLVWKSAMAAVWRKLLKDKMEELADWEIFGQLKP